MAHLHARGVAGILVRDYDRRMQLRKGGSQAPEPTPLARGDCTDDFTGRMALRLLEGLPVGEPWFLQVNFPGPHEPFDPPAELARRYEDVEFPGPVDGEPHQDHRRIRRNYAAMIEGIDEWVGRLLDAVARRGELDNTIVVYASDHGEMLGDLGRWFKSIPHEPSVHVPLVVSGPGVDRGVRSDALVELFDLAPTFCDLAGVAPGEDWEAQSIAPILRGGAGAHRDVQVSSFKDWRMATDGRWKLVLYDGGDRLLFDLKEDPAERCNLADADGHAETIARLTAELERALG
jgi:arylsulfatase A-like enzyme